MLCIIYFYFLFSKANACLIIAFCNAASIEEEDELAILDESDRLGEAISFSDQNYSAIHSNRIYVKVPITKLSRTQTLENHRSLVDYLA